MLEIKIICAKSALDLYLEDNVEEDVGAIEKIKSNVYTEQRGILTRNVRT